MYFLKAKSEFTYQKFSLAHFIPVLRFTEELVICFAQHKEFLLSICNAALGWRELKCFSFLNFWKLINEEIL